MSCALAVVGAAVVGAIASALIYHNNVKTANALIASLQAKLTTAGVKV